MSKKCYICEKDIGLLSFRLEFDGGYVICADCAKAAGLKAQKDIEGATLHDVVEWVAYPEKRQEYINRQLEKQEKQLREVELKAEEEKKRKEEEAREAERIRLEEEKKAQEAKEKWEKQHFPEGRIHTSVFIINVSNWHDLDNYVQKIQDKGNKIISVDSTGIVMNDNSTPIIITYCKCNDI